MKQTHFLCRCCLLALALLAGGCTEPNPDYQPPLDAASSCLPGDRVCEGQTTFVCVPQSESESFVAERDCPGGSRCEQGSCLPEGDRCTSSCLVGQVCTIFVDPQTPAALATFCAEPAGTRPGGSFCTEDSECQSGFCVGRERYRVCYQACDRERDCLQNPALRCGTLTATVNGVKGEVQGCLPAS